MLQKNILNETKLLGMMKILKLLTLTRMLRLGRVMRYYERLQDTYNLGVSEQFTNTCINFLGMVLLLIFYSHLSGCLQFGFPWYWYMDNQEQLRQSWVWQFRKNEDLKTWKPYIHSVFRSSSQMLSIGYGNEPPKTSLDGMLTGIFQLIGAILFAIFIGYLTTQIQKIDTTRKAYKDNLMQVKAYMRFHKLPQLLKERVTSYYENRFSGMLFDEGAILADMNPLQRVGITAKIEISSFGPMFF